MHDSGSEYLAALLGAPRPSLAPLKGLSPGSTTKSTWSGTLIAGAKYRIVVFQGFGPNPVLDSSHIEAEP